MNIERLKVGEKFLMIASPKEELIIFSCEETNNAIVSVWLCFLNLAS
jgi:hypothetical protein